MTVTELFVFAVVGRLIIYLMQKAPYKKLFEKSTFLTELFECSLCLGCWIYTLLSTITRKVLFVDVFGYVPIFSELITGASISMIVWLIQNGWEARFMVYHLDD